jgi:hypothetical protein
MLRDLIIGMVNKRFGVIVVGTNHDYLGQRLALGMLRTCTGEFAV